MVASLSRVQSAISKRIRGASKRMYQSARWRNLERPRVLFIVGCQRSGTTLMLRLFDADINCRVFGEFSELSSADKRWGIRLNPLPDVAGVIDRVPAPLVVVKPLVETQNTRTLLNYFPGSRALFMYRRYADVVQSDLAKFGPKNGIRNLRPIAEGDRNNWRSAGASASVREIVRSFYSEDMNENDAAALFWYARNQLFFDLHLADGGKVMLCQYEHFVRDPVAVMKRIYDFAGAAASDISHLSQVHSSSVSKGAGLACSPPVRELCDELQARLDDQYLRQTTADGR